MRICLFATADNPHVLRWTRFLAGRGHELLCLCDRPGPHGFLELPPCPVEHPLPNLAEAVLCFKILRIRHGWYFFRARTFRAAARRFRPDVVHGMEALSYGYATARCGGFARVLTPWGVDILHDPKQSRVARWLVTHALRNVEAITTNMPNLAEVAVKEFGADPERVRPFSWGVDREIFHRGYEKEREALRERWQIAPDAVVFLSNRQIREHWGVPEVAEAALRVAAQEPKAVFVFLRGRGDPALEERLRRRFEEAGVARQVRWVGEYLGPRDMAAALNLAVAFVNVPRTDLLSLSLLEGMACGCAPVAADLPAYRERLRDGENALLVARPGDSEALAAALLRVARDPQLRQRFAERNAALIAEKDDWARCAPKMEEVYRWALEHRLR